MPDYISREALAIEVLGLTIVDPTVAAYASAVLDRIQNAPTVQPEVRHGRWITTVYTTTSKRGRIISNKKLECSECGYSNGRKLSNYCPNCGVDMREVEHG